MHSRTADDGNLQITNIDSDMPEFITLAEIEFDSGTRRYSCFGCASRDGFYKDKIISIGSITREVPLLPGECSIADATLVLNDADKEFRILRASDHFRNREVAYKFGDALNASGGHPCFRRLMFEWNR